MRADSAILHARATIEFQDHGERERILIDGIDVSDEIDDS